MNFSLIPIQYKILAILLVMCAIFAYGFEKGNAKADEKLRQFEIDNKTLQLELEKEQNNIKEKIVTQYVDKIKIVKEKEYVFLNQATNNVPAQFNLSNGWIWLHDASAQNGIPDATRSSDGTPSDIKDNQALTTIISNYAICHQTRQQLTDLQRSITETKKLVDSENEKNKKNFWSRLKGNGDK